jgi:hypothetical protein
MVATSSATQTLSCLAGECHYRLYILALQFTLSTMTKPVASVTFYVVNVNHFIIDSDDAGSRRLKSRVKCGVSCAERHGCRTFSVRATFERLCQVTEMPHYCTKRAHETGSRIWYRKVNIVFVLYTSFRFSHPLAPATVSPSSESLSAMQLDSRNCITVRHHKVGVRVYRPIYYTFYSEVLEPDFGGNVGL